MRKSFVVMIALVALSVPAATMSAPQESTLLIVPREDAPVKVGMDVGTRFPTILLSYKIAPNGTISLHGWSGQEWVNISSDAYQDGTFFKSSPASALIVVEEGQEVPVGLIPSEAWCPSVYSVSTTQTRPLIHLFGRQYDFKYADWKWFSDNYHLPLENINPDGLHVSWYHQRLSDRLKSGKGADFSDLRFLQVVRSPQIATGEEAAMTNETEVASAESITDEAPVEPKEVADENPLTNAVPQAVVLGDASAGESMDEQPADEASSETESQQE